MNVSLVGVSSSFPETIVSNDYFGEDFLNNKNKMFLGTKFRRHIEPNKMASDLIVEATQKLLKELEKDPKKDIDIILTNVSIPDESFNGCGAIVRKKLDSNATWIFDIHNTGCVAFIYMVEMAKSLMITHKLKSALICTVQTAGGRIFSHAQNRNRPQAAIPGDGCGVAYLELSDESPFMKTVQYCYNEYADDMYCNYENDKKWWEPKEDPGYIDFTESKIAKITMRGNRLVPKVVRDLCSQEGITPQDLDIFITNQPNTFFLRNWREALQIPEEKHLNTFKDYANLFGAGIPVTFDWGLEKGLIKRGDLICLAGFSHAGDYAAATLLRWKS